MTMPSFGSSAIALARSLPPVASVMAILPVLRSTILIVLSPSLTHNSAPPSTTSTPFGPDALPLFICPTKPAMRDTIFVRLGVEDNDRLVVLLGEIAETGLLVDGHDAELGDRLVGQRNRPNLLQALRVNRSGRGQRRSSRNEERLRMRRHLLLPRD